MFKLKSNKNQKINETRLVQVLFYTFPLWFIVGNLAITINTLLFIVTSLILIQRKQLTFRFSNSCWLLFAFFLYLFISTTIQFLGPFPLNEAVEKYEFHQYWTFENSPIFKSFFLTRFLILIFVIDTLFFNKILNLKKFSLSSLLCTSFVCFDIILQYFSGFDLFGYKRMGEWNSGPFGNEWIAGGYLLKFSFFSFFFIFESFKNKNFNTPLLIFVIVLHLIAIVLSGNKMPLILFLLGCAFLFLLVKKLRLTMFLGVLIFSSIFVLLVNNDNHYERSYKKFLGQVNIVEFIKTKVDTSTKLENKKTELIENNKSSKVSVPDTTLLAHSGYNSVYLTAITIWKEQPFFGFGLKSFRIMCWEMMVREKIAVLEAAEKDIIRLPKNLSCSNHAHNYYLEFLSETGVIGTILLVLFFLILLKDSFYYLKKYYQQKNSEMDLLLPVIILFFIEIWPIKSSGSFFTTGGATFFWLITAILISARIKKTPQI